MITLEQIKEEQEKVYELIEKYKKQEEEKELVKKFYELEYPDIEGVDYFYIGNSGGIFSSNWTGDSFDKGRWEIGNGFPSFELAKKKEKQELLITRFNHFRDKCNGDWKPDFDLLNEKYFIYLDRKEFKVLSSYQSNYYARFGYFKNEEDCQRAIELFGDEIKELF